MNGWQTDKQNLRKHMYNKITPIKRIINIIIDIDRTWIELKGTMLNEKIIHIKRHILCDSIYRTSSN